MPYNLSIVRGVKWFKNWNCYIYIFTCWTTCTIFFCEQSSYSFSMQMNVDSGVDPGVWTSLDNFMKTKSQLDYIFNTTCLTGTIYSNKNIMVGYNTQYLFAKTSKEGGKTTQITISPLKWKSDCHACHWYARSQ